MKSKLNLNRIATPRNTLIAFILFFVNAVALTIGGSKLEAYSNQPKLDFHLSGYNVETVYTLFSQYGDAGRSVYFWLTVIDTPFPFFVALFGCLYATVTWLRWNKKIVGAIFMIASLSFLLFDNVENVLIYTMLNHYPHLSGVQVSIASVATQIKLCSLFIFYGMLLTTAIYQAVKRVSD